MARLTCESQVGGGYGYLCRSECSSLYRGRQCERPFPWQTAIPSQKNDRDLIYIPEGILESPLDLPLRNEKNLLFVAVHCFAAFRFRQGLARRIVQHTRCRVFLTDLRFGESIILQENGFVVLLSNAGKWWSHPSDRHAPFSATYDM